MVVNSTMLKVAYFVRQLYNIRHIFWSVCLWFKAVFSTLKETCINQQLFFYPNWSARAVDGKSQCSESDIFNLLSSSRIFSIYFDLCDRECLWFETIFSNPMQKLHASPLHCYIYMIKDNYYYRDRYFVLSSIWIIEFLGFIPQSR